MDLKRTYLNMEHKYYMVQLKKQKPKISQRDIIHEFRMKFGIEISRMPVRTGSRVREDIFTLIKK